MKFIEVFFLKSMGSNTISTYPLHPFSTDRDRNIQTYFAMSIECWKSCIQHALPDLRTAIIQSIWHKKLKEGLHLRTVQMLWELVKGQCYATPVKKVMSLWDYWLLTELRAHNHICYQQQLQKLRARTIMETKCLRVSNLCAFHYITPCCSLPQGQQSLSHIIAFISIKL